MNGDATHPQGKTPGTWVSSSKEQALTFTPEAAQVTACDNQLIRLSEQGFGVLEEEFQKIMSTNNDHRRRRFVQESQLASEFTATQFSTSRAIGQLFLRECQRNQRLASATLQARQLLKQEGVMARWVGPSTMEIWQCQEVSLRAIKYRPSAKCFRFIPITLMLDDRQRDAFLDPELRIVSLTSPEADCSIFRIQYLEASENQWLRIDTQNGLSTRLDKENVYQLIDNLANKLDNSFDWTAVHSWSLYNDTNQVYGHLEEMARLQSWRENNEDRLMTRAENLAALPGGAIGAVEDWFWSRLLWFRDRWIFLACAWSTFLFLRDFLFPLLLANCLAPIYNGYSALLGRTRTTTTKTTERRQQSETRRESESEETGTELVELTASPSSSSPPLQRRKSILKRATEKRRGEKQIALDLRNKMVSFRRKDTKGRTRSPGTVAEITSLATQVAGEGISATPVASTGEGIEGDEGRDEGS